MACAHLIAVIADKVSWVKSVTKSGDDLEEIFKLVSDVRGNITHPIGIVKEFKWCPLFGFNEF